jgi:hypothetical protein
VALERNVDGSGLRRDHRRQDQESDQEGEVAAAH